MSGAMKSRVVLVELQQLVLPLPTAGRNSSAPPPTRPRRPMGAMLLAVGRDGQLVLAVEGLVAHRVPAGVACRDRSRRDPSAACHSAWHDFDVPLLGGADEVVVARSSSPWQRSRKFCDTLSVKACGSMPAAWADFSTFCPCSSVPVRKCTSAPVQPHEARQHIAGQRGVGVPDMRRVVHVIDRRGDVVAFGLGHRLSTPQGLGNGGLRLSVRCLRWRGMLRPRPAFGRGSRRAPGRTDG